MTTLLSDALVSKGTGIRRKVADSRCPGLYADISASGQCSFRLKVWSTARGAQESILVGKFNPETFTTDTARREAFKLKGQGGDIVTHVKDAAAAIARQGVTFNQVADEYIAFCSELIPQHGELLPRRRRWYATVSFLKPARKAFGNKGIADVTARDIVAVIRTLTAAGKLTMAEKVRIALHSLFKFAAEAGREYVAANPCSILPPQDKPQPKERVLDEDEIRVLWWGLDRPDVPCDRRTALAFKLILATALRPSEVLTAQRNEIKEHSKLQGGDGKIAYRIPAVRGKRHRAIVQPLNSLAQEIVAELVALDGQGGLLFPSGFHGAPLDVTKLSQALNGRVERRQTGVLAFLGFVARKGEPFAPFTSHDLRRTAATHLEVNDVSLAHIAQVLDHQKQAGEGATKSTLIYARGATNERRATLERLDCILREIIGPAPKVVRLRAA